MPVNHDIETRAYKKSLRLLFACYFVISAWLVLIGLLLVILVASTTSSTKLNFIFAGLLIALIVIVAGYVLLAWSLRCEACGKSLLIEAGVLHKNARKRKSLDHWATIILDVLLVGKFRCMYCGENYQIVTTIRSKTGND